MLPVAELRLALPIAINVFNMPWWEAFGLSVIGNIIPVPFLLLFFDGVSKLVQRNKTGKRFIDWLLTRTAKKTGSIEKYKHLGLIVFVAIPLPLTGAWTASLISYILGLKVVPSFIDITIGVIGALTRRNAIIVFMSIELMLNAVNLTLVAFGRQHGQLDGQVFVFFVMAVAAAEVAVGLALLVAIFRKQQSIDVDRLNVMRW